MASTVLTFEDNRLLMTVLGEHDEHLLLIEDRLGVEITPRGNKVAIQGTQGGREMARQVLVDLYERALEGLEGGPCTPVWLAVDTEGPLPTARRRACCGRGAIK